MNIKIESDAELIRRFNRFGEQSSFTALVQRHEQMVMGVCFRILRNESDAQDAAQASFIQLAVKAKRLNLDKPIAPWLYTVARQKAMDRLKARKRRAAREELERQQHMRTNTNATTAKTSPAEVEELLNSIDSAIAELPRIYRSVVVFHYLKGQTHAEIAESLACKPSTVSMRLTRAKEKLRVKLRKRGVTSTALGALGTGTLRATTPSLPANFAANTFNAAASAASSGPSMFGLGKAFSLKNGLITAGSIATIATSLVVLNESNPEEPPVENASPDVAEAVAVPEQPTAEMPDNLFDLVQFRAHLDDPRYNLLLQLIRSEPEQMDALRNKSGETLLNAATRYGNCGAAFLLLWHGAEPDIPDHQGNTPLMHAVRDRGGVGESLRDMLIYKGADINAHNNEGDTPLILAVEKNNYLHAEFLLWMGADIHPRSASFSRYPGALARTLGHTKIAKMLQVVEYPESGEYQPPDLPKVPEFVQRSLIEAALKNDLAKLEALIAEGADINSRDESRQTILHKTIRLALNDVVTYLIFMGADVNARDNGGRVPFVTCSGLLGFDWDRARYMLLLAGASLDVVTKDGHNPLTLAAARANGHPLQLAIWAGIDPEAKTEQGTAMSIASKAGHQRIVDQLIMNGVTEKPFSSDDPAWQLHTVARKGEIERIKQLIASGISPDLPDEKGNSPLINAIHARRIDVARSLLESGANPAFITEHSNKTVLHHTINWDYWEVHRFREELLRTGIDPNVEDKQGRTPLIQACRNAPRLTTQIPQLLLYGADINHRDKNGMTALDYAKELADDTVATYLLEMGANE